MSDGKFPFPQGTRLPGAARLPEIPRIAKPRTKDLVLNARQAETLTRIAGALGKSDSEALGLILDFVLYRSASEMLGGIFAGVVGPSFLGLGRPEPGPAKESEAQEAAREEVVEGSAEDRLQALRDLADGKVVAEKATGQPSTELPGLEMSNPVQT